MKKLHVAVIALATCVLVFGLTACDKVGTDETEPETQATQTTDDGTGVRDVDKEKKDSEKGKKDEGTESDANTSGSTAGNSGSSGSANSSSNSGTSGNGNNGGGNSGGNTKPNHTHKWATRYVVDQKAWTETVHHEAEYEFPPSYQVNVCSECGYETTGEIWSHIESEHGLGSYYTATRGGGSILIRDAWDETINHPEKGHNETYCTKCGAIQ